MSDASTARRLRLVSPELEAILTRGLPLPTRFAEHQIRRSTVCVSMRDGVQLASDLYLPAETPAPVLVARTPYGRSRRASVCLTLAQCGYAVVSQDCRGTGDSEPDEWEYYLFEPVDSIDVVEWIIQQDWCDGFVAGFGGSYAASTQWCMAAHPRTSTIVPEVGGLGVTFETARLYMFLNAYQKSIGKGSGSLSIPLPELERQMLPETLAGGVFDEPLTATSSTAPSPESHRCSLERRRKTWKTFCALRPQQRVRLLKQLFQTSRFTYVEMERLCTGPGLGIAYGAHSIPSTDASDLSRKLNAPALLITGWYDWNLNDVLASWALLRRSANDDVKSRTRLLITPSAHSATGYQERSQESIELQRSFRTPNILDVLLRWYSAIQEGTTGKWPAVIYYLMGANEWLTATSWPPQEARQRSLFLGEEGTLTTDPPSRDSPADQYVYDPSQPTPTVGGSIVSHVYTPGSVDVSEVQKRPDVLTYTSPPFAHALDVVGPIRLILYASSSAIDTDFSARLTDVFPDGRAVQLQSGILRARYRGGDGNAHALEPRRTYMFEIDMWATANRFDVGHRLRLDVSSADFPRYDRNSNCAGTATSPSAAIQTLYHDHIHPSELRVSTLASKQLSAYF